MLKLVSAIALRAANIETYRDGVSRRRDSGWRIGRVRGTDILYTRRKIASLYASAMTGRDVLAQAALSYERP